MKSVHLRIDRIVVEGLSPSGQQQLAGALTESLRELAQSGIADEFAGNTRKLIQSLNAGQLRPGATPAQAATQIVHSIRQNFAPGGSKQGKDGKHV